MADLSVIIPTYNRAKVLQRALEAYVPQTARRAILEILVIDDGSTDGTEKLVSQCLAQCAIPIRYLRQQNHGIAAARNHGIRKAQGELILFMDDDVIPAPTLVEQHLSWHRQHLDPKAGVCGYVPWSPEVHPTPLMRWSISKGPHAAFHYHSMRRGAQVAALGYLFVNASVKAAFLRESGLFDEDFRSWGFEDTELGYRLHKKGMTMLYNPDAVGYHYKRISFAEFCRFPSKIAAALRVFAATEAGRAWVSQENRRKSTRKYRLEKFLVKAIVPVLTPLRPLLDSQIPLPWLIYQAFYAYYGPLREGGSQPAAPAAGGKPKAIDGNGRDGQ